MFAKKIIDSDLFLDMPLSAQSLYFHLSMRADDDGFVDNPKRIQRMIGASDDDFKILLLKQFVVGFDSGVVVIKHWRIHNYIQKDRYKPTIYQAEKACFLNGEQNVSKLDTQVRLGKDRLGKEEREINKEKERKPVDEAVASPTQKYGEYGNVILSEEELEKLKAEFPDWEKRIERLSEYIASSGKKYKSHFVTIRSWAKKDKPSGKVAEKPNIEASESERLSMAIVEEILNERD